ncbi:bifunctional phosphoribosyl-AMP cyclohydrolase/phosphoribosyl-ATP diphosphatase HisIE [Thalassotalea agariperforans]
MQVTLDNLDSLAWEKMDHLLPVIIQDAATGAVLMQGFMNQEALTATLKTEKATFFSRSKQRLWMKGESSNNTLDVKQVLADCDKDCLLIAAEPNGPTCHLNTTSCFPEEQLSQQNFLSYLERFVDKRSKDPIEESYTARLLSRGTNKVAQKVGEEGVEVVIAALAETKEDFLGECADLFYHTLVLLKDQNIALSEVMEVLQQRHSK